MSRWIDLLASFGVATLLHGLIVLGAVWFWTLRPPEFRPVFQGGDVSLAVTFVAAAEDRGPRTDDGRRTTETGQQTTDGSRQPARQSLGKGGTTDPPSPERFGRQAADIGSRKLETADILTDPETEMPEEESQTADGRRQTTEGRVEMTDEGRQKTDSAVEPLPEEGEDQDTLDVKTAASVSAQASANVPTAGLQNANQTSKSDGASFAALRQGVNGVVRMQSEIRPYYPLGARVRGEEGAVTVRVWVNSSGRARRCEVARSSGYPALDEAAVDAARRARYVSTRPGTWHAEAETTLTFRFRLTE